MFPAPWGRVQETPAGGDSGVAEARIAIGFAVLALGAGIGVTGCGSGQSQGATEPTGNFPVQVTTAKFPNHQKLAESSYLVLAIKNAGSQTIPDLAVTINTQAKGTPNLKSPATSTGSGQGSFNIRVDEPNLASHFRPVWVLEEHYPKLITDKFPLSKIETRQRRAPRPRRPTPSSSARFRRATPRTSPGASHPSAPGPTRSTTRSRRG